MAELKDSVVNGNLRVTGTINGTVTKADCLTGFEYRQTGDVNWGQLQPGNGYTLVTNLRATVPNSTDPANVVFATKAASSSDGRIHMQIDGFFYQNVGNYKVIDESYAIYTTGPNVTNASDGTSYYLLGAAGTGNQALKRNGKLYYYHDNNNGHFISIGDSTSTTQQEGKGLIRFFNGVNGYYTALEPNTPPSSSISIKLPSHGGSLIALQNSNEINMDGYNQTRNVWINWKGSNNTADTTYTCLDYYFCDRTASGDCYKNTTLHAGKYEVYHKVTLQYNTTNDTLDFVFA